MRFWALVLLLSSACSSSACSTTGAGKADSAPAPAPPSSEDGGALSEGGSATAPDGPGPLDAAPLGPANLRIMAANTTSGASQSYDPGEGIRIFQGLKPDVVLLQEFNYGTSSDADARRMVDLAFGTGFSYFRETGAQIPNGIVSRFPIAESGTWTDPAVSNRGFAYAKITLPGARALWAVSLHLLTSSATDRDREAAAIVAQVKSIVPEADFLVVGGDFNTSSRAEQCIGTLAQIVVTEGPFPDDGHANDNTSGPRTKPHDWLLADGDLAARRVPTAIGQNQFPAGLVFDSRVYAPLLDVAPVQVGDCAAPGMQHMAVVRDFSIL